MPYSGNPRSVVARSYPQADLSTATIVEAFKDGEGWVTFPEGYGPTLSRRGIRKLKRDGFTYVSVAFNQIMDRRVVGADFTVKRLLQTPPAPRWFVVLWHHKDHPELLHEADHCTHTAAEAMQRHRRMFPADVVRTAHRP